MPTETYYEGSLENKRRYCVYGRARNNHKRALRIDDNISLIGEDAALVLPDHNFVGVFDGAGGTADIGSPLRAALTAAKACSELINRSPDSTLGEVMEYARQAVEADTSAGICVASLARFIGNKVEIANAGDTSVSVYNPETNLLAVPGEQQINLGEPSNYLGKKRFDMPERIDDLLVSHELSSDSDEVFVMSDGAMGSYANITSLEDYHFESIYNGDVALLNSGQRLLPSFKADVEQLLKTENAKKLADRQRADYGWSSPEIERPALFSSEQIDWDIWKEIVKPYLKLSIKNGPTLGSQALVMALVDRPISWPHERPHEDDATVIRVFR